MFLRLGGEYPIYQKIFLAGFYAMLTPLVLFALLWPLAFCVLFAWWLLFDFYKWFKSWIKT